MILGKNTYFFKGAGWEEGRGGLRADPHGRTKLKLCFLVILVAVAAKICLKDVGWF